MDGLNAHHKQCPICQKTFYASNEWVYKRAYRGRIKYFCSYSCTNEADRRWEQTLSKIKTQAVIKREATKAERKMRQ